MSLLFRACKLFKKFSIIFVLLPAFISTSGVAQETSLGPDFLNRIFLQAVQGDDIAHVEYLIKSGVDINATDEFGRTAAMLAFSSWNAEMLMLLLRNEADVHSEDKTSHLCLDYILDVHPKDFDQRLASIDINLRQEENTNIVKLEFIFSLRQFDKLTLPSQIIGVGEISPFEFEEINTPSVFYGVEGQNIITETLREAIRDGYRQLGEVLVDRTTVLEPRLVSTVGVRGSSDRLSLSLGRSNSVQEGDIFGIYSGNCHNPFGPPLNTAIAVIVHERISILEIQGRDRGIQYRDTIALFNKGIDLDARRPEDGHIHRQLLRLDPIPNVQVALSLGGGILRRDITSDLRELLVEEAPPFNLQVIPITQSP